jgi:O-antigen/teichoic acid export membrane protein
LSDHIKKLAGQTAVYGLGTILPRFLNYLLTPFLTYGFSTAQFGINSELYAYISFLNVLFTYGMETAFFNFYTKEEDKRKVYTTALMSLLITTGVLTLIFLPFSGEIAINRTTPNAVYLPSFIVWCILIIATDAIMAIPFARLRAENKAIRFSLYKLLNVVINFSLTIFFIVYCRKAHESGEKTFMAFIYNPAIGIGYAFLANLIANIVTVICLTKQIFDQDWKIDKQLWARMLGYAWPLLIVGLAGMINETLDRIILKYLIKDGAEAQEAQGIYGACYKIAILMTIFIQAFRFAAEPFFFGRRKETDSKQSYALVMKYFVIFCLFIFLATVLNLSWIQYFIGKNFRVGLKVVPVLLLANLCLGVVYNLSIWFKLSGQTRFGAIIAIAGALITIVVNLMFVPKYSYVACAWATLAAYAGMMVISYMLGKRYYPISYNLRALTVYVMLALALYFLSFFFRNMENHTLRLLLNNLFIVVFVFIVYKLEINNLKKVKANAAG